MVLSFWANAFHVPLKVWYLWEILVTFPAVEGFNTDTLVSSQIPWIIEAFSRIYYSWKFLHPHMHSTWATSTPSEPPKDFMPLWISKPLGSDLPPKESLHKIRITWVFYGPFLYTMAWCSQKWMTIFQTSGQNKVVIMNRHSNTIKETHFNTIL